MSAIGPGQFGPINVAGSFAGAQRNNADADRVKETASARAAQADLKAAASKGDDVSEAELSSDRDPDGRADYVPERPDGGEADPGDAGGSARRPLDPSGERGTRLDVEV